MKKEDLIEATKAFVKEQLHNAETGHDWFHTERVYRNALLISKSEKVNVFVVSLGALLHDIADSKFHNGNEELGPERASNFLESLGIEQVLIDQVVDIIRHISFKNSLGSERTIEKSPELLVVQDADRLDAIGAIGIARAFNYGGFKNRTLYDPEVRPQLNMTKSEYKMAQNPTINHFYEKLLLLKNQMNTDAGRALAADRHDFMLKFLDQFYKEVDPE